MKRLFCLILCSVIMLITGCSTPMRRIAAPGDEQLAVVDLVGPAGWVSSCIKTRSGSIMTVTAGGAVKISGGAMVVSPDGYGSGEVPQFALLGKFGVDGKPFVVGKFARIESPGGEFFLKINTPEGTSISGQYSVSVRMMPANRVTRLSERRVVTKLKKVSVAPDGCVVWIFVDGLRPDLFKSMMREGALPNLSRIFYNGGVELPNVFSCFPSETISSTASFQTGVESAVHGIKGPIMYDRRSGRFRDFLSKYGPSDAADYIQPHSPFACLASLFGKKPKGGPKSIYDYLSWREFKASPVPINPGLTGLFWPYAAVNDVPMARIDKTWERMDEICAKWASQEAFQSNPRFVELWFPDVDSISHEGLRGPFGRTRATLGKLDFLFGLVEDRLKERGLLDKTQFVLFSDHGHVGGRNFVPLRCDVINELLFPAPEQGGLGMNVVAPGYERTRPGKGRKQHVVIPTPAEGFTEIFLPRGGYSGKLADGPNSLAELLSYKTPAGRVNMIKRFLELRPRGVIPPPGAPAMPIDMVIVPDNGRRAFVATRNRGWAIVERKRYTSGVSYRYVSISPPEVGKNGNVTFKEISGVVDPFGYAKSAAGKLMGRFVDNRTWLKATYSEEYPDAVAAVGEYAGFEYRLKQRGLAHMPDLFLVACNGWYFNHTGQGGSMHGYLSATSRNCTFFMAGPGLPQGAIFPRPARLRDMLPTTLDMLKVRYNDRELDSVSMFGSSDDGEISSPVKIAAVPSAVPYARTPEIASDWKFLHDSRNPLDAHNLVADVVFFGSNSLVKLTDEVGQVFTGKDSAELRRRINSVVWTRRKPSLKVGSAGRGILQAVRLDKWSVNDTISTATGNYLSMGNLLRVGRVIDCVQDGTSEVDQAISRPLKLPTVLGTKIVNPVVDDLQEVVSGTVAFVGRTIYRIVDDILIDGIEGIGEFFINFDRDRQKNKSRVQK